MNEDPQHVNARLRRAVELMTAWNDLDDEGSVAIGFASQDLLRAEEDDRLMDEAIEMITGLMSLSEELLVFLEQHSGQAASTFLRQIASRVADGGTPSE